jgi:hypothetical protein
LDDPVNGYGSTYNAANGIQLLGLTDPIAALRGRRRPCPWIAGPHRAG